MRNDFKTKLVRRLFILISVIGFSSAEIIAQTKASKDWAGIYSFTDSAQGSKRQSSYDVVPMVEYTITIKKSRNNQLAAAFEANGMQTFENYQCSVKEAGGKLNFYFQSGGIPDGGTDNPQGFKKGALLFTLAEIKVGAKSRYQFQSAGYKLTALSPKAKNQPIYFQKTK